MKKFKSIIALMLIPAMIALCSCGADESKEDTGSTNVIKYNTEAGYAKKTETVYVNLDNSGNVTQTIVSDWIHTIQSKVYVDDVTNLSKIENVKDDSVPDVDGQNMRWYMDSSDLYYQGTTDAKPPVEFNFSYSLDGKMVSASDLVGKSGKVEIKIQMNNIDERSVKVNGVTMTMYNPLVVVGGVALNDSKFQNVVVTNGKTIGTGNTLYAAMVGFPGLSESLGINDNPDTEDTTFSLNDTFIIKADVEDFDLGNFMFAALPISSLGIGLNDVSTSVDDVRENLSKLQSLQKTLQSINADDLLNTLSSDPDKLSNLSSLIEQAASIYDSNKALIDVLNKYTSADSMSAIKELTDYIGTADFDGLASALDVINSIYGNDASAARIQEGISLLKDMAKDLNDPAVKKAINNLPETVSTMSELEATIEENADLIEMLKMLANSDVLSSIDSALTGLEGSMATEGLSSITNISGNTDEIVDKMTAWIKLGKAYSIFTKKNPSMASSVVFVFKTDSIKSDSVVNTDDEDDVIVEQADIAENEQEKDAGVFAWVKKLFKK